MVPRNLCLLRIFYEALFDVSNFQRCFELNGVFFLNWQQILPLRMPKIKAMSLLECFGAYLKDINSYESIINQLCDHKPFARWYTIPCFTNPLQTFTNHRNFTNLVLEGIPYSVLQTFTNPTNFPKLLLEGIASSVLLTFYKP